MAGEVRAVGVAVIGIWAAKRGLSLIYLMLNMKPNTYCFDSDRSHLGRLVPSFHLDGAVTGETIILSEDFAI